MKKRLFVVGAVVSLAIWSMACDGTTSQCCSPANAGKQIVVILPDKSSKITEGDSNGCVTVTGDCADNVITTTS